jgi:sulfur dioxygenase
MLLRDQRQARVARWTKTLGDAYAAHDYNGMTVSTNGEEKRFRPRLQVASASEYADLMNGLELSDPRLMLAAVPANRACGNRAGARAGRAAIA